MKALITGGAGFVGSHLTEHLIDRGWNVVVLDDLSTGSAENLAHALDGDHPGSAALVLGSVTEAPQVQRLARGCDVVFHLAAAVGVLTIQSQTLTSLRTNLLGTEVALDAALEAGSTFVLTSTSEIYGKNTTEGLTEDADRILGSPLLSRWSYAEAKAIDETLTQQNHLRHGLNSVIVRLFNTSGPRQSARYGMVLPRFVRQALGGIPLTVHGTGEQTRCFANVADVVPAIAQLATTPAALGSVFNIGSSEQISINDLAARVIERCASPSSIVHVDYETAYGSGYEDMERRVPDCSRLHDLIGFRPTYTLDDTIDSVIVGDTHVIPTLALTPPGEPVRP